MKNLKKTLSLVLVATMMLGILVIGAGAAFTDQEDVNYAEAVEVLSAIKVLEGFEDGTFKPENILTREQAAKIIAYAMIGKTAADALVTGNAPFSDVAATRWSAGYIAFCVDQGIINGYGDGRFGPADTLTGFQFAKMLLCALGYGQNDEFVGSNWTIEVAKLAIPLGIFDGNTEGASNSPCTREAAALYAFNAMTGAMTVNYADALGIYYSGTNALNAPDEDEYLYTLGYKVFRLKKEDNAVVGGRNGHYWTINGVAVSEFYSADTVLGTDTRGTPFSWLTTKGEIGFIAEADATGYVVYFNGQPLRPVKTGTDSVAMNQMYFDVKTETIRVAEATGVAPNATFDGFGNQLTGDPAHELKTGATTQLIDTDDLGNKVDVINYVEKTVMEIVADPISSFGTVKINGVNYNELFTSGYENLEKGDYALYVEIDGEHIFEKCATISGKVESEGTFIGSPYYVINGKQYSKSALPGVDPLFTIDNYDAELVYYLDDNGYIVASSTDTVRTTNYYGLVLASESGLFNPITGTGAYAKAYILTQTGETILYDVVLPNGKPDFAVEAELEAGDLIKYQLTSNGKINSYTEATAEVTSESYTKGDTLFSGNYVNSSTYFFFYVDKDAEGNDIEPKYSVIKGYTNAPTVAGVNGFKLVKDNGIVEAVVLDTVAGGAVDVVFVGSADYTTGRLADNTLYYKYNVYRDGTVEQMMFSQPLPLHAIFFPAAAFSVEKDPTNDIYTAEILTTDDTTPLVYADETYFIGEDTGSVYNIVSSAKVYKVTYGVRDAVIDVQTDVMVAPKSSTEVKIVAVDATLVGTDGSGRDIYNVNALFYRVDPKY